MYEAVVDDLERWLAILTGEVQPKVAASRHPDAVLLKPWVDPVVVAVELRIEHEGEGSAMTVIAYCDVPELPDETRRWVRYRLGTVFEKRSEMGRRSALVTPNIPYRARPVAPADSV
jgi:hypothetical protein